MAIIEELFLFLSVRLTFNRLRGSNFPFGIYLTGRRYCSGINFWAFKFYLQFIFRHERQSVDILKIKFAGKVMLATFKFYFYSLTLKSDSHKLFLEVKLYLRGSRNLA